MLRRVQQCDNGRTSCSVPVGFVAPRNCKCFWISLMMYLTTVRQAACWPSAAFATNLRDQRVARRIVVNSYGRKNLGTSRMIPAIASDLRKYVRVV